MDEEKNKTLKEMLLDGVIEVYAYDIPPVDFDPSDWKPILVVWPGARLSFRGEDISHEVH